MCMYMCLWLLLLVCVCVCVMLCKIVSGAVCDAAAGGRWGALLSRPLLSM